MNYENPSNYKPIDFEKPFAVVKFLDDAGEFPYSEVPTEWLSKFVDENNNEEYFMCWWPRGSEKNVSSLISSKAKVDETNWIQLSVEFDKYWSTLRSARKRAEDSNYQTTDENNLGKGFRRKRVREFSSDDEEINNKTKRKKQSDYQNKSFEDEDAELAKISKLPIFSDTVMSTEIRNTCIDLTDFNSGNVSLISGSVDGGTKNIIVPQKLHGIILHFI